MNFKNNPHLKIIIKEMCKRVKAPFTKIDFNNKSWFMDYEWTLKQQDNFSDWIFDYLMNNSDARREIMRNPNKKSKRVRMVANSFILSCGWKCKY